MTVAGKRVIKILIMTVVAFLLILIISLISTNCSRKDYKYIAILDTGSLGIENSEISTWSIFKIESWKKNGEMLEVEIILREYSIDENETCKILISPENCILYEDPSFIVPINY